MPHPLRRNILIAVAAGLPVLNACRWASAATSAYDPKTPDLQFDGLKSPFDVAGARASKGQPAKDKACDVAPTPVIVLDHESKYKPDTNSSEIDDEREAKYAEKLKLVSDFYNPLARVSDRYVRASPRVSEIAICVLDWLENWASAGALEEGVTEQGRMVQAWALASLSTTWLKVRMDPNLSPAKRKTVVDWLGRLNDLVIANFERNPDESSRSNNHRYWANWAVCATAVARDDRKAFDWAAAGFDRACKQIGPDGVLPLEMDRRSKALHYHNFSLGPLVLHAETLIANGVTDAYERNGGAIARLVDLVVRGLADPSIFEDRAREIQDVSGALKASQLAWMEPWFARFPDPRLTPWLEKYRPMVAQRLGGDLTLLFAQDAKS